MTACIPALCEHCRIVFPSGILPGAGGIFALAGSSDVTCEQCGQSTFVLAGTFQSLDDAREILLRHAARAGELKMVSDLFTEALERRYSPDRFRGELFHGDVEALRPWIELIPRSKSHLQAFLTLLVDVISPMLARSAAHEALTDEGVQGMLDATLRGTHHLPPEEEPALAPAPPAAPSAREEPAAPRPAETPQKEPSPRKKKKKKKKRKKKKKKKRKKKSR